MSAHANMPGSETASNRKEAVKKAFNQEYQATMKAMEKAADRARAQVLDQRLAIETAARNPQNVADTAAASPSGQAHPQAHPHGHAPGQSRPQANPYQPQTPSQVRLHGQQQSNRFVPGTQPDPATQVMLEIALELRKIITTEIDQRMMQLTQMVEEAIQQTFPKQTQNADAARADDKGTPPETSDKA